MTREEAITEKELLEMLRDDEFELTTIFTIKTPSSKEVPFIKLEVLDKIKAEITHIRDSWEKDCYHDEAEALTLALDIINKCIGESEE